MSKLSKLSKLILVSDKITDQGIFHLIRVCPEIKNFYLKRRNNISKQVTNCIIDRGLNNRQIEYDFKLSAIIFIKKLKEDKQLPQNLSIDIYKERF